MTRTISLTETTEPLFMDPVFRAGPLILTGAQLTGISTYRVQIWRKPQDARETDAVALATSYATAASQSVSLALSGTSMDISLSAGDGAYDDLWFVIAGVQTDGQVVPIRADWVRVIEAGIDPTAFVIGGVEFTLDEETNTGYFTIGDIVYSIPLVPETEVAPGTSGWVTSIVNDIVIFTKDGVSYSTQAVEEE